MSFLADNKKYKFSTKFTAVAKTVSLNDNDRKVAVASLDKLASVFNSSVKDKIDENPDLLFISSALIGLDQINLNDDGILAEDLLPIADKFIDKFFDQDHDRSLGACGAISSIGYSIIGTEESIPPEQVLNESRPIQLVVGGYLWRLINKELCQVVELSSAKDDGAVSTSFEILFDNYWIVLSATRNIKDGIIVKPGDADWDKYDALLRVNGGSGKDGDLIVGRILKDDILPVGAGIVRDPASGIKGVLAVTDSDQVPDQTPDVVANGPFNNESIKFINTIVAMKIEKSIKDIVSNEMAKTTITDLTDKYINFSQNSVNDSIVSNNSQEKNHMEIEVTSLQDVENKWAEIAKLEAASASKNIRKAFEAEIVAKSAEWAKEMEAKENLVKTVEAAKVEAETKITALTETLAQLQSQVDAMKQEQIASKKEETFSSRMATLDDVFDLDDESRAILSEEVKAGVDYMSDDSCKADEEFAAWVDKKKKLMKEKTKDFIKKKADDKKAEDDKNKQAPANAAVASVKPLVDAAAVIASVVENQNQGVPNSSEGTIDIKTQFANAFGESVTVNGVKANDMLKKSKK